MFEKDREYELYTRDRYTMEEDLYKAYITMRETLSKIENYKYKVDDPFSTSNEFKQGFIAGVKIMSSILLDL